MITSLPFALALLAAGPEPIPVAVPNRSNPVSYGREVSEILAGKCVGCHNAALAEGKLKLEDVGGMLKGGKHGPALVPGKAEESLLFRMASHRVEPIMPPKDKKEAKPLSSQELGLIKLWIDGGAKDDSAETVEIPVELGPLPPGVHPILALDLTADGRRLASGRGNVVRLHDADSGVEVVRLGGHKDVIQSLRFSPDGSKLAAGSFGIVTVWSVPKFAEIATLNGHTDEVRLLAASSDGKTLVSSGPDGTIRFWNLAEGKEARKIAAPTRPRSLAVSSDGSRIAVGGEDGKILLVNSADGQTLLTLEGHAGPVVGLAFFDGNQKLVSGSEDTSARIWSIAQGDSGPPTTSAILKGHEGPVLAVAASADGRAVLTGGRDGTIRFWKSDNGELIRSIGNMAGPVLSLAASPGSSSAASGSADGTARLFRLDDGGVIREFAGLESAVASVAFSPDGSRLATATVGGAVKVWEVETGQGVVAFSHRGAKPNDPLGAVHRVVFLGDGSVATASAAKTVKTWTYDGSWGEPRVLGPHVFRILALDFSPDGSLLAAGGGEPSRSGEIKIWEVAAGKLVKSAPEGLHSDTVFALRFSPDGKLLASGSADRFLKVLNLAEVKEVRSFEGHTGHVLAVDWKGDGKELVSGGADDSVKIWDFETGDQLRTLAVGPKKGVTAVRWSMDPGLTTVVGASGDGAVRFWNPTARNVTRTFSGASDYLDAVAISQDRHRVAAGGANGVLYLWNGETGALWKKIGEPAK